MSPTHLLDIRTFVSSLFVTPILLLIAVSASACATVQPYERETLARTDMQFEGAPEIEEGEQHATEVREGTVGGFGSGGGGCGCN